MKHAKQRRRDTLNQPTDRWFVDDHTPGQMPQIYNVDARSRLLKRLFAIVGKSKERAQAGGKARAETFHPRREQAEKIARQEWSVQPDLSRVAVASKIAKRAGQREKPRTIRRWIAPLRPSTP